jgi:hypothetical protein
MGTAGTCYNNKQNLPLNTHTSICNDTTTLNSAAVIYQRTPQLTENYVS